MPFRRIALCLLANFMSLITLASPASGGETLRVLTWPGYADRDLVQVFEKRHNVKVEVTLVSTDDDLWQKLSANNGGDFDVFAANTAELKRYIDRGISVPLDLENIPNVRAQLPRFRNLHDIPGITRSKQVYAIPYTYSEMGLIYNRKLVKETPTSMAAMWDPQYRGQVLAYDGSNHNFTLVAMLLGSKTPFQLQERSFKRSAEKLVDLRHNVLTFYSQPEEAVELFRENDVALVFANYGRQQVKQLQAAGADIGYVIPKEGALAWLDCWAVTRGTRNKRLAEAWINYTLEKPVSTALTERQGLDNTIQATPSEGSGKIIWLEPVEDALRRAALWSRIMSGDRPGRF
jgi:putative spermidine/putrescine transport system substrate-binding protein